MKIYIRPFCYCTFNPFLLSFFPISLHFSMLPPSPPPKIAAPVLLSGRVFNAKRQIGVYNLGESLEKSKKNV